MGKVFAVCVSVLLVGFAAGCDKSSSTKGKPTAPAAMDPGLTWPSFRGSAGDGIAAKSANPLDVIHVARDIVWRTPLEVEGYSSPIIWGDLIFLTGEPNLVLAFDRATGKPLWSKAVDIPPPPAQSPDEMQWSTGDAGLAAATPCTDGRRVFAFFADGVMACFDFDGKQLWARRIVLRPENTFGLAASPILFGDLVIQTVDLAEKEVDFDMVSQSFIVALRASDGAEQWRTPRPGRECWSTPVLTRHEDRDVLVTISREIVIAYDPADGNEIWRVSGTKGDVASSPVVANGMVYVASDAQGPVLAIRLGGAGDMTKTHVTWQFDEDMPDTASPLVDGPRYFQLSDTGALICLDAMNGKFKYIKDAQDGLDARFSASPVLAGERLYLMGDQGELFIVAPATGEILSQGKLDDGIYASPAVIGQHLYIRTEKSLLCIGPKAP